MSGSFASKYLATSRILRPYNWVDVDKASFLLTTWEVVLDLKNKSGVIYWFGLSGGVNQSLDIKVTLDGKVVYEDQLVATVGDGDSLPKGLDHIRSGIYFKHSCLIECYSSNATSATTLTTHYSLTK